MTIPDDCRYTKEHEWIRLGDDGLAAIGVTDFAQGELGDIVFVELKTIGTVLDADDVFGTVEAVKTVSDLFAPIACTIEQTNDSLEQTPQSINSDPYGEGWMVKVRPNNISDLDPLMSAEEYARMIGQGT